MFAQGLQEDLAQCGYQQFSGTLVPTASMGLAVGGSDADLSTLLRTADQALYKAKGDGRNRICILTLR